MGVGTVNVRRGVSEFLQVMYAKPLDICEIFAAVLNLFLTTPVFGKGCPTGVDDSTAA